MRRSREDLLRVLLDTATDLAALRDVEAVLQAIVRRTRAVVGADMAYISLNDPERGDTYIRQSDGVTTPAYRALRMPLGVGVLGQVATGLAPFQTTAYLDDASVVHDPEVDEIVRAEAVETIMGAPLTVAGRVIGALIVAERRARRFGPEEVSCVESIAKQAAVAIDNSLRFEEIAQQAELFNAEHKRSAAELQLATRILELDRRLLDAVMVSPDVGRVLTVGRGALDDDLYLRDTSGALIATTADPAGGVPESGTAVAVTAVTARTCPPKRTQAPTSIPAGCRIPFTGPAPSRRCCGRAATRPAGQRPGRRTTSGGTAPAAPPAGRPPPAPPPPAARAPRMPPAAVP